ncbi:MAG: 4-oxalocrotonate tautomerase family protein [Desulfobacterales bacterium]|jgi:4-oxalocrotonate tautomerase
MPYVNIRVTNENVTKEQKTKLIKGATQLLVDVLDKNPATTVVVIDEVNTDNWGIGGECVTEIRKRGK